MVYEAVSLRPQNTEKLQDVGRLLRRGRAKFTGSKGENMAIPEPLYSLLKDAVRNLTQGRSLVLIPEEKQLTTQQAGELLGVSRPFLIRLLDAGEMPFSLVGRHRRIKVSDLIDYSKRKSERKAVLDKMARGEVQLYTIVFPEGLTYKEIAARLQPTGFVVAKRLRKDVLNGEPVKFYPLVMPAFHLQPLKEMTTFLPLADVNWKLSQGRNERRIVGPPFVEPVAP